MPACGEIAIAVEESAGEAEGSWSVGRAGIRPMRRCARQDQRRELIQDLPPGHAVRVGAVAGDDRPFVGAGQRSAATAPAFPGGLPRQARAIPGDGGPP